MKKFASSVHGRGDEPREAPPPYSASTAPSHHHSSSSVSNHFPPPPSQTPWMQASMPQAPMPQPPVVRQFPPKFNVYAAGWRGNSVLGVHQDQPLYAISTHSGWSGKPDVILHNGPSEAAPALATASRHSLSSNMTIGLPPLQGGPSAGGTSEELVCHRGFSSRSHTFDVEVGPSLRRERFEWRRSRGADVHSLGGASQGHKLVRMTPSDAAPGYGGGSVASDGGEVVATFARYPMSVTKNVTFSFVGTGTTGVLGERWAVMAVITALAVHEQEKRQRAAGAGASGAAVSC